MTLSLEYLGRLMEKKQVCALGRNESGLSLAPSPTAAWTLNFCWNWAGD
eukprot:CAMPEP_0114053232 /NCGR_PEP_ID=MMETSP1339-20121228/79776_1 /TAXON_ID=94617 /ORGANISM="Fibrocapsa japonica" /LENGTH=48 /assembly_acc=CAM_ASM_000762